MGEGVFWLSQRHLVFKKNGKNWSQNRILYTKLGLELVFGHIFLVKKSSNPTFVILVLKAFNTAVPLFFVQLLLLLNISWALEHTDDLLNLRNINNELNCPRKLEPER